MSESSVSGLLANVITEAADSAVKNAQFDVSTYGVVTSRDENNFTIAAFGGTYKITSNHDYIVGQKVVVTAMQKNFRNLVVTEGNTSVELLTVKGLVQDVDSLSDTVDGIVSRTETEVINNQAQINNTVTTWYYSEIPTISNQPASAWTTDELKSAHKNDVYYDTSNGKCYRWVISNDSYCWTEVIDSGTTNALAMASFAQDTANSKAKVFYGTPSVPYQINDLWIDASGNLYRCITGKSSGENYKFSDWTIATKYTDDTTANSAIKRISALESKQSSDVKKLEEDIKTVSINGALSNLRLAIDSYGRLCWIDK